MVNDPSVTQTGLAAAAAIFGRDKVITEEPRMGGEDFAKYDAPKAMLCLGGGFEDEKRRKAQHNPQFDIDERALPLGVAYFLSMWMSMAESLMGLPSSRGGRLS